MRTRFVSFSFCLLALDLDELLQNLNSLKNSRDIFTQQEHKYFNMRKLGVTMRCLECVKMRDRTRSHVVNMCSGKMGALQSRVWYGVFVRILG